MKKGIICLGLTLLAVFAQPQEIAEWIEERYTAFSAEQSAAQETPFERELGITAPAQTLDVTLYFRYGQTDLLGAHRMSLDIRREETVARSIVEALLAGPDAAHERLTGLFPRGTKALSVTGDETTIFVTLSREFLGKPEGAPADWEDQPQWQTEAAARRLLAAQSIVLSLTEEALCQRVQLYVADSDDDMPERIPMYWFGQTDSDALLTACGRDEGYLLTADRALRTLLSGWQRRDWATVYGLLSPENGQGLPTAEVFARQMEQRDISLISFDVTPGTVNLSGTGATLVLSGHIRSEDGGDAFLERESVALVREEDNWVMSSRTLDRLMIRD